MILSTFLITLNENINYRLSIVSGSLEVNEYSLICTDEIKSYAYYYYVTNSRFMSLNKL